MISQEFNRGPHLAPEEIYVPAQHQPLNPEDEDDIVPDQHAAFGIQRATQAKKELAWRDLGLDKLVNTGPGGLGERGGPVPLTGMATGGTGMRRREGLGGGFSR